MLAYAVRRLLLIPLTLLGIMAVNFAFTQMAPGGPIEQVLATLANPDVSSAARVGGQGGSEVAQASDQKSAYRGAEGMDPAFIRELEVRFGFDQPPMTRFFKMVGDYLRFDFGKSFYSDQTVLDLILQKMPTSISLGLWSTLIIYMISIPLGIAKAVRDGEPFDVFTSWVVVVGYAVPGFLFGLLLIVLFAGGSYWSIFPLRGLTSDGWETLSATGKILDYFWHLALPVSALTIGGFAGLTMLTKNSFLEEINKQYAITARAKGLSERRVLYGHIFRNAMLLVVAGLPHALIGVLFTGALLIEIIFSLDGMGLLGFEAVISRNYPVVFGTLYIFGLIGLLLNLAGDLLYHLVDPRIDFSARR